MEEKEMFELWKLYGKKLDEGLLLNRQHATAITRIKVQSFLGSMQPIKIAAIAAGIAWVVCMDVLIVRVFSWASVFFLASAIVQVLLTKLAIGIYLYQSWLLYQASIDEPVLATQTRLARLQSSTLWVARVLFLQLPVWTTFYWNQSMLEHGKMGWYILQGIVTIVSVVLAGWLFINIKFENRHKKWFMAIFSGREWSPLTKSMDILKELEDYDAEPAAADNDAGKQNN